MSVFSLSLSLTGHPRLKSGIWYSHGSILSRGYMLTVSNFVATYLTLLLGALVALAVTRLWRIGCAVLFHFSDTPAPSWEESQNNVFLVNSKTPLNGCVDSVGILSSRARAYRQYNSTWSQKPKQYRRATYVLISALLVGLLGVTLKLATPLLIALIPITKLGIAMPTGCDYAPPNVVPPEIAAEQFVRSTRQSNAAFAMIDQIQSSESSAQMSLPEPGTSFTLNGCPLDTSICHNKHPFTFSSHYTLTSQNFALNVKEPFSLTVSESCYRPRGVISTVDAADYLGSGTTNSNATFYGLFYGPTTIGDANRDYTVVIDENLLDAGTYAIIRRYALADASDALETKWAPNSNITQGGDTAFLLYYVNGVLMLNSSSDPIFATESPTDSPLYSLETPAVPIICDTKYVFCVTNRGTSSCSSLGGVLTLMAWLKDRQDTVWRDIKQTLVANLGVPLIYKAASGPAAMLAGQSADVGVQMAPHHVSTFNELSRLSKAGMTMIASFVQLSVNGYWNGSVDAASLTSEADPDSLCNQVIMESPTMTTIPVLPYLLYTVFSILVVIISYTFGLIQKLRRSSLNPKFNRWSLHLPGQLHREVTESLRGKDLKLVDPAYKWPDAPYQSGPIIITQRGTERFSSGMTGSLVNMPDGAREPLSNRPNEPFANYGK